MFPSYNFISMIYLINHYLVYVSYLCVPIFVRASSSTSTFFFFWYLTSFSHGTSYSTVYVSIYKCYTKCTKVQKPQHLSSQLRSQLSIVAFLTLAQPTNLPYLSLSFFIFVLCGKWIHCNN